MNRTLRFVFLGLTALAALTSLGWAQNDKNQEDEYNVWMERKLHSSQEVLAGLANADFDQIESNAETMNRLTKIEKFLRRKDAEEYRTQLRIFEYANRELIRSAKEKNIDGAALAYTQLTLSCVNCHKVLRN